MKFRPANTISGGLPPDGGGDRKEMVGVGWVGNGGISTWVISVSCRQFSFLTCFHAVTFLDILEICTLQFNNFRCPVW